MHVNSGLCVQQLHAVKFLRAACWPVTVGGWWRCPFHRGWFWFPCLRLWCRLFWKKKGKILEQYTNICSKELTMYWTQKVSKKAFQTFLACLWPFTRRWIRVRVGLGARLGLRARQSRTRLLILWITVCYFFLWPGPRVWIRVRWSLLRWNRRKGFQEKKQPSKAKTCSVTKPMDHLLLPSPSCFLRPSPSCFLLWREILSKNAFSLGSGADRKLCVCVCGSTWSLFLPESESDGVGSDSDGDPLSASRSLEEPPRTFFGGGGRWNERETGNIFKGQLFIYNQVFGPGKVTLIVTYYRHS